MTTKRRTLDLSIQVELIGDLDPATHSPEEWVALLDDITIGAQDAAIARVREHVVRRGQDPAGLSLTVNRAQVEDPPGVCRWWLRLGPNEGGPRT